MSYDELNNGKSGSGSTPLILPAEREVLAQLLRTLRHSVSFHYYERRVNLSGRYEEESPHDLTGPRNRLEWEIVRGLALQFRTAPQDYFSRFLKPLIEEAVKSHRQQRHHRMWNGDELDPLASPTDLKIGALDTLIALSEPRKYNGGQHSPWEILRIVSKFPKHKAEPCQELIQAMRRIAPPELGLIQNLTDFPNIGLDPRVYYQIQNRMNEAVARIRKEGYEL